MPFVAAPFRFATPTSTKGGFVMGRCDDDGETQKIRGLKCRECGAFYPPDPIHVCELCFGPLEVDYDYDFLRLRVSRQRLESGPPNLWRYKDLLPVTGNGWSIRGLALRPC
jgi:hypothetical protein